MAAPGRAGQQAASRIVIAVGEPLLRAEAVHAAAATTAEVLTVEDPRDVARAVHGATAVLVDALMAGVVASQSARPTTLFVGSDPGPLDYEAALKSHADQAFLLPAQARDLLSALGSVSRGDSRHYGGRTVAVTGAGGGIGASTFAAALARATGGVLIDAVADSGGLDLLLGVEAQPGARWPELRVGDGSIDPADLRRALPSTPDGVAVLSAARSPVEDPDPVTAEEVDSFLEAIRAHPGVRVVDCHRGHIPPACDAVVVLAAAEVRSAAIAAGLLSHLRARSIDTGLVLRHRQWSGLSVEDMERITHSTVVAEVPTIRGLTRKVEMGGLPTAMPKALGRAADAVVEQLGLHAEAHI